MKLVLFDIDGTLIWPDGAGREAMRHALTEVFGTSGPIDSLRMDGKTDRKILTELLTTAGLDQSTIETGLSACFEAMARHLPRITHQRQMRICPGVPALLVRLSTHPDVLLGLLTGNLEATSPIKLRAVGLDPNLFRVGAYGDRHTNRSQLPAVAIARARALIGASIPWAGGTFLGKDVVIIGDTPTDVTCGQHLGVTAIGVATGRYPPEALSAAGADYVFPDLTDTDAVIQAIL
jgi:phosphoglycolate phosphatase